MFYKIPERWMHKTRWILLCSWVSLTVSLIFDPITSKFTMANHAWSPLRLDLSRCIQVQGECFELRPYAIAPSIFWGLVLPIAILSLLIFGHELWRRICPLSFISQLPRRLGIQRQVRMVHPITEKITRATPKIKPDSWLGKNHTYLQFGLLYLGLCGRILFFNATRPLLAGLFVVTVFSAIAVGYLYAGKSWCQYFCPMAPVQTIYTQPLSLLSSRAYQTPKPPQSMCREITDQATDQSACVACKKSCIDIDSEKSYWATIHQPQQSFLRYGYWGLVVGYFTYYYLYAGNWNYYLSGVWAQDEHQLNALFNAGFYIAGHAIPIPKLLAVPLTLAFFTALGYGLGRSLEHGYGTWLFRRHSIVNPELVRHRLFCLVTFTVFHFYFAFGGRPFLKLLPTWFEYSYQVGIILLSILWLRRVWGLSQKRFQSDIKAFKKLKKQTVSSRA